MPYTLGIAGGASFGIALSTIIGLQQVLGAFANPLFGFGGAMLSVAVVFALSRKRFFDPNSMVLFGIVVSLVFIFCLLFSLFPSRSRQDADNTHVAYG